MKVEIDISEKDYFEFNKFVINNVYINPKIVLIFTGLAVLVNLLIILASPSTSIFINIVRFVVGMLIFFATFSVIKMILLYLNKFRTKRTGRQSSFLGKKIIEITEQGLRVNGSLNKGINGWQRVSNIETNKNYIYIFLNDISGFIVPKRSFEDHEEIERFLDSLKRFLLAAKCDKV